MMEHINGLMTNKKSFCSTYIYLTDSHAKINVNVNLYKFNIVHLATGPDKQNILA